MQARIELNGVGWDPKYWDKQNKNFQRDLKYLVKRHAALLRGRVRQAAPREKGKLQNSIRSLVRWTDNRFGIDIYSDLKYAHWQEWGTGIYSEAPGASRQMIVAPAGKAFLIPARSEGMVELRKPYQRYRAMKSGKSPIDLPGPTFKNERRFGRFKSESTAVNALGGLNRHGNVKRGLVRQVSSQRFKGFVYRQKMRGVPATAYMRRVFEVEEETGELMVQIEKLAALYGFE